MVVQQIKLQVVLLQQAQTVLIHPQDTQSSMRVYSLSLPIHIYSTSSCTQGSHKTSTRFCSLHHWALIF
uniref:Uncharacterized protein n=1 Tax=Anguilla anguilla TaxID=7936 RepID=A0A0E9WYH8_ANGAN